MKAGWLVPWSLIGASCMAVGTSQEDLRRQRQLAQEANANMAAGDTASSIHNLIANATFDDGTSLPWTASFSVPASGEVAVKDGALCLRVDNPGPNNWDAQVRHREMTIQGGHTYKISFTAWATQETRARPKVGQQGPPYAEYFHEEIALNSAPRRFKGKFHKSGGDDPTAEFAFHLGGRLAANTRGTYTVCLDDIMLEDEQFYRPAKPKDEMVSAILINQVGYLPGLAKIATLRTAAKNPGTWRLLDATGKEVATGKTQPMGLDVPSGETVHAIDFTPYHQEGKGFVLAVGKGRSRPFDISKSIYHRMKFDGLSYFYHNRSGIPIVMPYAGQPQWTRPAGHTSDRSVPCLPGSGCSYRLDVSGGWYDAGDHGKYVVNGGIAVWTLLNLYERSVFVGNSAAAFADGTMAIPEQRNGVPDLLDEIRYEMEFLLRMQVPDGDPKAGMAHHKIHDKEWTALGLAPHEDPMLRYLYPPSTAATLNLAAVAAQSARVWKSVDPAFSAKCLKAAEKAWDAAERHPTVFAPSGGVGGGPYDDQHLDDEFYWAAAELFITTKKPAYKQFMAKSPLYLKVATALSAEGEGIPSSMTWQEVGPLGTFSLATVPGALPPAEQKAARKAVVAAADVYLDILKQRGFRVPIHWTKENKAPWGSNSFLLNNLIVLGMAADITGRPKYMNAVAAGMDYLLGRNPLDQSYVTGHGTRPLQNPHHRFWAFQSNNKYPKAPPGCVSGGPNSGLEDPYVKAAGLMGCVPEKCFLDNIESWSTNEITINWNAPFVWVLSYLDEKGALPPKGK